MCFGRTHNAHMSGGWRVRVVRGNVSNDDNERPLASIQFGGVHAACSWNWPRPDAACSRFYFREHRKPHSIRCGIRKAYSCVWGNEPYIYIYRVWTYIFNVASCRRACCVATLPYICSIVDVVVVEYSSVLAACDVCKAHVLIWGQAVARDSCEELAEVECCCSDVRASISIVVLVMLSPRHCDSTSSWYQFVAGLSAWKHYSSTTLGSGIIYNGVGCGFMELRPNYSDNANLELKYILVNVCAFKGSQF